MAKRVFIFLGVMVLVLNLVAWWLLSGFGCAMNTAGCATIRLDWSWDALRFFLPGFAVGAALLAIGLRRRQ